MSEYCALCGCDSFECGGGVTEVCIRDVSPGGGPYCARKTGDGTACGNQVPCADHAHPDVSRKLDEAIALLQRWKNRRQHVLCELWQETTEFLKWVKP